MNFYMSQIKVICPECKEELNKEVIRRHLIDLLPDYMIPSYFVQLKKLPITSNGKVNRKALPSPKATVGDDYVAPSNETQRKLVEIWAEVLDIEKEEISTTVNFFDIGGNSIKAMIILSRIHMLFNVEILIDDVFVFPTIKSISNLIEASYLNKLEDEIAGVDSVNIRI